jgi:agmatinase
MLDPLSRWRRWTADGVQGAKEMHVGLPTFAALPYTEDAADLDGVDVAIVGAPYDNQIDHPGARYGPRAIRAAEVVEAGVIPLTLGGDHWITNPCIRAVAERHGPLGLVHFDAHNDTDPEYLGVTEDNHSTVFHSLVAGGLVDGGRYAQIGLRGYYAFAEAIDWQREQGIRTHWMHDVRDRGIGAVIKDVIAQVGGGPAYVTVDVDVLDPAFAPGTGTLDPGGMTTLDLFWAAREVCRNLDVGGADVVEVAPLEPEGADITAFAGHYVAREFLNGIALRRASSGA